MTLGLANHQICWVGLVVRLDGRIASSRAESRMGESWFCGRPWGWQCWEFGVCFFVPFFSFGHEGIQAELFRLAEVLQMQVSRGRRVHVVKRGMHRFHWVFASRSVMCCATEYRSTASSTRPWISFVMGSITLIIEPMSTRPFPLMMYAAGIQHTLWLLGVFDRQRLITQ